MGAGPTGPRRDTGPRRRRVLRSLTETTVPMTDRTTEIGQGIAPCSVADRTYLMWVPSSQTSKGNESRFSKWKSACSTWKSQARASAALTRFAVATSRRGLCGVRVDLPTRAVCSRTGIRPGVWRSCRAESQRERPASDRPTDSAGEGRHRPGNGGGGPDTGGSGCDGLVQSCKAQSTVPAIGLGLVKATLAMPSRARLDSCRVGHADVITPTTWIRLPSDLIMSPLLRSYAAMR